MSQDDEGEAGLCCQRVDRRPAAATLLRRRVDGVGDATSPRRVGSDAASVTQWATTFNQVGVLIAAWRCFSDWAMRQY